MDDEGWYSATPEVIAAHHAQVGGGALWVGEGGACVETGGSSAVQLQGWEREPTCGVGPLA